MEVEMDVAGVHHHHHHHHQQNISSQTLESMLVCTKPPEDKKPRPPEETLKCPRCDSINTKFCYYNNYSLTQPRYFCKSCRRYWTKGGTLRNVPVGGGCRKNKRSSSSSSLSSPSSSCATSSNSSLSKIRGPQDHPLSLITPNSNNHSHLLAGLPHLPYDSSTSTDLSLAFARLNGSMGYDHFDQTDHHLGTNVDPLGFLDPIKIGFLENTNTSTTTNNRFHHNVVFNGGNLGNEDMGSLGNLMGMNNVGGNDHGQEQNQILNTMFHGDQDQELISCSGATAVVPVKQEACNMVRPSEVGLWGVPWQMGAGGGADPGTMVHEVESGRSMIGGWSGLGSTNWHGLINSPLM